MTKTIPLTQGQYTIVDDEDYERVSRHLWFAHRRGCRYYAGKTVRENGKVNFFPLHRFILNVPVGTLVDHANGDSLDNRRANLRVCTKAQNGYNRDRLSNNRSGYKGVTRKGKSDRWVANIGFDGRQIHLGTFNSPEEASCAYNAAALQYHGDFAHLNGPPPQKECQFENIERMKNPRSKSGYLGVIALGTKWMAVITVKRKQICLGRYDTPDDAARIYDAAAIHYRGKGTRTNFPQDEEE